MNVVQMMIFGFERVENILEKGENTGYHQFLLFPQYFKCFSRLTLYYTNPTLNDPEKEAFRKQFRIKNKCWLKK